MQSVIRKESYGSVKAFWLDKPELDRRIERCISKLTSQDPRVSEVILFGSVAEGRAVPSSDVDLVIVLDHTEKRHLDRAAEFVDYFVDLGLGADLFVFAVDEVRNEATPIYRTAIQKGTVLYRRDNG
jgi:predicted nucleotidyltransferase